MSQVGTGFGAFSPFHRVTKMPVNPLDKSTIISVYPAEIHEVKPTIFPGYFHVPACAPDDFALAVVGPSSWWKEISPEEPALEIPTSSVAIANSVIRDWANGLQECNMGDRMPGLFYVPGAFDKKTIILYKTPEGKAFADMLAEARTKQKNWFNELVKKTDILWAASNGSPLVVSALARLAAKSLGMEHKPWLSDVLLLDMSPCPACGQMINPQYPVCRHCKNIINPEKAKALNLKFAV